LIPGKEVSDKFNRVINSQIESKREGKFKRSLAERSTTQELDPDLIDRVIRDRFQGCFLSPTNYPIDQAIRENPDQSSASKNKDNL
jgi:hypothetical protein